MSKAKAALPSLNRVMSGGGRREFRGHYIDFRLRPHGRPARIVAPGCQHHVTARDNRREPIFFEDGDQELYLDILSEQMAKARVEVWSCCLIPNHGRLILTPQDEGGIGRPLANKNSIDSLERAPGRGVARRGPGRKKAAAGPEQPTLP